MHGTVTAEKERQELHEASCVCLRVRESVRFCMCVYVYVCVHISVCARVYVRV